MSLRWTDIAAASHRIAKRLNRLPSIVRVAVLMVGLVLGLGVWYGTVQSRLDRSERIISQKLSSLKQASQLLEAEIASFQQRTLSRLPDIQKSGQLPVEPVP